MEDKELKQREYKTQLDKFIGQIFQKAYNKLGIAGSIFFGLIFLIGSIVFFIRLISNNYFSWFGLDLSDKNEIGDALGGLTAPFIGITGIILTFLAFWVQYQFNRKQYKFYESDKLEKKLDEISSLLEIICNRDKTTNENMALVFSRTVSDFIHKYGDNELKINGNILQMVKKGFLYFYKIHYPLKKEISDDEIDDKVQISLNVYRDFEALIQLLIIDLKIFDLSNDKKIDLIGKFHNKFKIIYDGYEDNLAFLMLYYLSLDKQNIFLTEFLDIVSATNSDKLYLKSLASEIIYLK